MILIKNLNYKIFNNFQEKEINKFKIKLNQKNELQNFFQKNYLIGILNIFIQMNLQK